MGWSIQAVKGMKLEDKFIPSCTLFCQSYFSFFFFDVRGQREGTNSAETVQLLLPIRLMEVYT